MKKSSLHVIADERVDYFSNNAEFTSLLEEYHLTSSESARERLWMIAFQASCNFLKARMGHWWTYERIEEMALDMLNMLFGRIENKDKWPEGYRVINLPTVLEGIFLTLYYSKGAKQKREVHAKMISLDALTEAVGDRIYNYLAESEDTIDFRDE